MSSPSTPEIRAWALANGLLQSTRGRIPAEIVAAFEKANKGSAGSKRSSVAKAAVPVATVRSAPAPKKGSTATAKATSIKANAAAKKTVVSAAVDLSLEARVAHLETELTAALARLSATASALAG